MDRDEFARGFRRGYILTWRRLTGDWFDPFVPFCPFLFKEWGDPRTDYEFGYDVGCEHAAAEVTS